MDHPQNTGLTFGEAGIANALQQYSLSVPLNQRPYAWEEDNIKTLLADLTKAFDKPEAIYFLGMIVITSGIGGQLEIADGQQRLATASVIIAAARDYLLELDDAKGANRYESTYLLEYDPRSGDSQPKLKLNQQDHDFFLAEILNPPESRTAYKGRPFNSHDRIRTAAHLAAQHLRNLTANLPTPKEKRSRIYDWMDFLHKSAKVILLMVPGYVGSTFKMFETLNARGMRASQVDILKNFIFDLGKGRIADLQARWTSMLSTIESMGDEDDLLLTYIRHYWISQHGPTTERELGEKIEAAIRAERQAIDFVSLLDAFATDYVALLMPREHPRWSEYSIAARNCLYTITCELRIEQILPLLLAITRHLPPKEAEKAFTMALSWSVRFLIVGGAGGGVLERQYGLRAAEISKGEIKTVKHLAEKMVGVVPNDDVFKRNFATATVRRAHLARYYLRAIHLYQTNDPHPQFVPNDDPTAVNLEHILPVNPSGDWKISQETAESYHKRLGNMVLLGASDNVKIGNKGFNEKKAIFKKSPYDLTAEIAQYPTWGPKDIDQHQVNMAQYAPRVWPL